MDIVNEKLDQLSKNYLRRSGDICEHLHTLSKYASNYENALILLERNKHIHENANVGIAHTRWATHGAKTD
jgi:glucosamine 6-phosphate synthetase-like amidotransferase/phosphosugar isomerase protein